ncbi:MAG: putative sulfate exporter family transporter, partial [Advenella sp.]
PWFIVWFLLASLTRSTGIVPEIMLDWINVAAKFLIVVALVAVGLSADMRKIFATGPRPILLGFLVWMAVSVSSLIVQYAMGQM